MSGNENNPPRFTASPRNVWYNSWTFRSAHRLQAVLPRFITSMAAALIGHLAYDLCDERRDTMRANLHRATSLGGPALDTLTRSCFVNFIQMIADTVRFVEGSLAEVSQIVGDWSGLEHLQAAHARGKGTVLITGHLGAWELGGILLAARGVPVTVVTLAEPVADLGEWRAKYREKFGIRTITLGEKNQFAFLEIVQTLRKNGVVALLVDRPVEGHSVPVQMFGQTTYFSPAASLLWQHTGATILPAFVFAQPSGKYASHAYPPIEMKAEPPSEPSANSNLPLQSHHANTQRIADFFSALLQAHPDQWYNFVPVWTSPSAQSGDSTR